jgi:hypothetical protein
VIEWVVDHEQGGDGLARVASLLDQELANPDAIYVSSPVERRQRHDPVDRCDLQESLRPVWFTASTPIVR